MTACEKQVDLSPYVSELRQAVYYGESQSYKLTAHYGYKESPYALDGKVMPKKYSLCFFLDNVLTDSAEYSVGFVLDGTTYSSAFNLCPPKDKFMAVVPIENFNESSITVQIVKGDKREEVELKSKTPEGTISYQDALRSLYKKQKGLVDKYCDETGNFKGEIHLRLIVKNEKSYWYIGLTNSPKNLKALLINGSTGDVLAVRDIG